MLEKSQNSFEFCDFFKKWCQKHAILQQKWYRKYVILKQKWYKKHEFL